MVGRVHEEQLPRFTIMAMSLNSGSCILVLDRFKIKGRYKA